MLWGHKRVGAAIESAARAEWDKAFRLVPDPDILDRIQANPAPFARAVNAATPPLTDSPKGPGRKPIKSARRLQALLDNEYRKEAARKRKARREAAEAGAIEVVLVPGGKGRKLKDRSVYPVCPHCGGESIRAGVHDGEQRYRCVACRRTYYGEAAIRPVDAGITLICCRCGGGNTKFKGAAQRAGSGIVGHCLDCGKRFTQGGRHHLDTTLAVLVGRIQREITDAELRAEVYGETAVRVLQGIGYTWNIPLDIAGARQRLRKEHWNDKGSYHPAISGTVDTGD
jgi:hypothetical protein